MATTSLLGLTLILSPAALTALRIAPLLTSTASLTHGYMEWVTTSSFLGPAPLDTAINRIVLGADAPSSKVAAGAIAQGTDAKTEKDKSLERANQIVVPYWFTKFFNTAVFSVVGLNSMTLIAASCNLLIPSEHPAWEGSKSFYTAGLVAAVGHYAFVPFVGKSVRGLIGTCIERASDGRETGEDGKAVEWVREWVGWHKVRMGTVDVVAWGCFAWGVVGALTV